MTQTVIDEARWSITYIIKMSGDCLTLVII